MTSIVKKLNSIGGIEIQSRIKNFLLDSETLPQPYDRIFNIQARRIIEIIDIKEDWLNNNWSATLVLETIDGIREDRPVRFNTRDNEKDFRNKQVKNIPVIGDIILFKYTISPEQEGELSTGILCSNFEIGINYKDVTEEWLIDGMNYGLFGEFYHYIFNGQDDQREYVRGIYTAFLQKIAYVPPAPKEERIRGWEW